MRRISPAEDARKKSLLAWAAQFPYCTYLDSCGTDVDRYSQYNFIIAVANAEAPVVESWAALEQMELGEWWFGALTYDLKNEFEPQLHTSSPAAVPFPSLRFFRPHTIIYQPKGSQELIVEGKTPNWEGSQLKEAGVEAKGKLTSNFSKAQYLETIQRLREHIREGDCYEINLAQNFTVPARVAHPESLWRRLTEVSPTPFAVYGRWQDVHLLCASPERFLQLQEDTLTTQPIKGTSPRARQRARDRELARELRQSIKEQAENVMIVDLSRHDLYQSAVVNGVTVPHLFEVQSFAKVHHLVSTVQATKRPDVGRFQALARMFPPGSMTGAPKFKTCQLIDGYEPAARGLYSGSVGYFDPRGNFDFNVVIRSMVYDASQEVISYHMGGAITWDSDPAREYEETLVKARAIRQVLGEQ